MVVYSGPGQKAVCQPAGAGPHARHHVGVVIPSATIIYSKGCANLARPIEYAMTYQPIACLKTASSGPRPAQQPASLPSTTTLGRLRIPCCFALAAMWA